MMALDGKTIIKEEITDKDNFDPSTASNRRNKGGHTGNSGKDTNSSGGNNSHIVTSANNSNNVGANSNNINNSSSSSRSCRTPDSPESVRAIAPRSPMSPQIHHSSLAPPPRPTRNSSSSPIVNGATTTPPPPPSSSTSQVSAATSAHIEQARLLGKVRRFLGSLVQLAQDVHPEVSDRVRALVLSLGSGGISIDEFRIALHDAINLPLRPYVIPLLKNHISLLQREIVALSRATNQTTLQYVTNNENAVMEFVSHGPPSEYGDIFIQMDSVTNTVAPNGGATSLVFKRRPSDLVMDQHHNGAQDWNDYVTSQYPPTKRLHAATHAAQALVSGPPPDARNATSSGGNTGDGRISNVFSGQPTLFEYPGSSVNQSESNVFGSILDKSGHRDERDMRAATSTATTESQRMSSRMSGEEEWKNIHMMLNCISAMVDKTKRAITILQQRGVDPQAQNFSDPSSTTVHEIRRQTEEKVAEFKRNAEEAVNQVKRQAVIEIQRAVVTAENRAAEVMAQERLRMEKFFVEMSRHAGVEREIDNKSPSITSGQNACWNCGRKATETCSGCNMARYCGAFCQHKDWEHHHQICGNSRTVDHATKHSSSQAIPLTVNLRGNISRSPPTPTAQVQSSQQQPPLQSVNSSQSNSLVVPNGIGSK